jgi:hypothetical protein
LDYRLNLACEGIFIYWFFDVTIDPGVLRQFLPVFAVFRRHHDDFGLCQFSAGAQLLDQFYSGHFRHNKINKNGVGLALDDFRQVGNT